jgi:hypothetical protein
MPSKPVPENPLKGKNIPPAPPVETVSSSPVESHHGNMAESYQGTTVERQTVLPLSRSTKSDDEKATIELSLYLRPSQDDKLEDLRRAYKKQTGKKISANELMRRLIDRATLDNIL